MDPIVAPRESKFERLLQQSILWIRGHRDQFWTSVGMVALLIGGSIFFIQRRNTLSEQAWSSLSQPQSLLIQNKPDEALKALDEWLPKYGNTDAGSYARFIKGDALQKAGKTADAAKLYQELSQTAKPMELRPLALSAEASDEELAGLLPEAKATAERFVSAYPDHYLAGNMYLLQARVSDITGDKASASSIYERFQTLYPQSPFVEFAKGRQQALGSPAKP